MPAAVLACVCGGDQMQEWGERFEWLEARREAGLRRQAYGMSEAVGFFLANVPPIG